MMQSNLQPQWRLVHAALAQQPEAVVQTTIRLWDQLAPELISIIGEGGFKPIFERSIHQAAKQHAWMAKVAPMPSGVMNFAALRGCLQAQNPVQAMQASVALFTIFLDILASLVGEELTTHLLHVAWRMDTSETPAKEFSK
ncbi:MAG: hypothetical protein JWR74_915 [Polaromonas sp.]|jgi:hypothetical protein|nr:hypothetical protein [Polaromonas sp.]